MALEPRIEAIRKKYDLSADDFWQIKQNGQWVCKHSALEVVAHKASIEWLPPIVIEANAPALVTSMIVTGKMGDRVEWSVGETNETNYSIKGKQPAYPWAMSEKRAKDRVILKLVGIHGLVYSDAEGDFSVGEEVTKTAPKAQSRPVYDRLSKANRECSTIEAFNNLWTHKATIEAYASLPDDWKQHLEEEKADKFAELDERYAAAAEQVKYNFDSLQSEHHGDRI